MAKPVSKITLGIDVSKQQLEICQWPDSATVTVANQADAIQAWLRSVPAPARVALEPTNHYHLQLVAMLVARGVEVYLLGTRPLAHYREAVDMRNKSDAQDAWLLARYLAHEGAQLRPYTPQDPRAQRLWSLLKRRASVVKARRQLQQSFARERISIRAVMTRLQQLLQRIDVRIQQLIRELGWSRHYRHCASIPGIGPLNAAALVSAYQRGAFANSDAFVAYLGLDVRLRESGRYRGKRKLTKRGDSELRRLLYCATQAARSEPRFEDYYQRQLEKGLSKIAAKVTLARKLARIAFTLMNRQEMFVSQPKIA